MIVKTSSIRTAGIGNKNKTAYNRSVYLQCTLSGRCLPHETTLVVVSQSPSMPTGAWKIEVQAANFQEILSAFVPYWLLVMTSFCCCGRQILGTEQTHLYLARGIRRQREWFFLRGCLIELFICARASIYLSGVSVSSTRFKWCVVIRSH